MAAKSISETEQVRYLLGLSSAADREHIESEYFEDDDAFQEMLTAEDDLIDAYARGELVGEERRRFEESFAGYLHGRDRIQIALALANVTSDTQPPETNVPRTLVDIFKIFQPPLVRTATISAMIVFVAVLGWLVMDRRRMANELRELRAQSAELNKRAEVLQQTKESGRSRSYEMSALLSDAQANQETPKHRERARVAKRTTRDGVSKDASSNLGSTIRGTATDPNGNVVSGAMVTLTDSARNFTRTQSTNKDGAYVFKAVPPGLYSIEIQAQGFKAASASGLAALVNTPTVVDTQLEFGAVSERINVTSTAENAINISDASLGNSFERKPITELPLNANNVVGLLSLQPAVSRSGYRTGERSDQSNMTLEGVDIIPSPVSWIRFQIALQTSPIQDHYRIVIKTVDGRAVTSVDWIEPLTRNQTTIDTPAIASGYLPSGDYVLVLLGKEPDGSFVELVEYSFKVIK